MDNKLANDQVFFFIYYYFLNYAIIGKEEI